MAKYSWGCLKTQLGLWNQCEVAPSERKRTGVGILVPLGVSVWWGFPCGWEVCFPAALRRGMCPDCSYVQNDRSVYPRVPWCLRVALLGTTLSCSDNLYTSGQWQCDLEGVTGRNSLPDLNLCSIFVAPGFGKTQDMKRSCLSDDLGNTLLSPWMSWRRWLWRRRSEHMDGRMCSLTSMLLITLKKNIKECLRIQEKNTPPVIGECRPCLHQDRIFSFSLQLPHQWHLRHINMQKGRKGREKKWGWDKCETQPKKIERKTKKTKERAWLWHSRLKKNNRREKCHI